VKKYICISLILSVLALNNLQAQNLHFSQFYASPLNLNPALLGNFAGDFRFVANHRNQWKSISLPYKTYSLAGDANFGKPASKFTFGAGILLNSDKAGDANMGNTEIGIGLSVKYKLLKNNNLQLSFGILTTYNSWSFDRDKLIFDSQYSNPNAGTPIAVYNDNTNYFSVNSGISVDYTSPKNWAFQFGTAVLHANSPRFSFSDKVDLRVDRRLNIHSQLKIPVASYFHLIPTAVYTVQAVRNELVMGVLSALSFRAAFNKFYLGVFTRLSDALILTSGVDYKNWQFLLSYDINLSGLKVATRQQGGFELALRYIWKKPIVKTPYHICPSYL